MDDPPFFSIITATRNCGDTIGDLIDSLELCDQSIFEWVVIDSCSGDSTLPKIYSSPIRSKVIIEDVPLGISRAWNIGLDKSFGEWVFFLGGDDLLLTSDSLSLLRSYILGNTQSAVFYTRVSLVDEDLNIWDTAGDEWRTTRTGLMSGKMLPHQGMIVRRSLLVKFKFDERLTILGDYDMTLKLLSYCGQFHFIIQEPYSAMRCGGISTQFNSLAMLREISAVLVNNNYSRVNLYFSMLVVRYFLRSIVALIFGRRLSFLINNRVRRLLGRAALPSLRSK